MRLARERVDIRGLGIREMRPRRARTGALLLEIPGADGAAKADALAREIREALKDREGVAISRPTKTAEIRVKDLIDSISAVEVAKEVALSGECQLEEVKVGPIRTGTNGLGTVWVRCPLIAANKVIRKGRLDLGWTKARVELLPDRPTTCFRCLRAGHVKAACPGGEDRGDTCYRCGERGHLARNCVAPPRCPLCVDTGRPDNHRVGGQACRAPRRKERKGGTERREEAVTPMDTEPLESREMEPHRVLSPMDTTVEIPRPAPLPLSRSQGPITEREQGPAPLLPSQPRELITRREQAESPASPTSPQQDWQAEGKGEAWTVAPPEPKLDRCRITSIVRCNTKIRIEDQVAGPSGAPQQGILDCTDYTIQTQEVILRDEDLFWRVPPGCGRGRHRPGGANRSSPHYRGGSTKRGAQGRQLPR